MHAAGSHFPAAAQAEDSRGTRRREGSPVTFQKVANIPKSLLEEEEDLAKAKCSQINYSNSFGTSQKVGLAILKRKTIVINKYSYVQCSTFSSE